MCPSSDRDRRPAHNGDSNFLQRDFAGLWTLLVPNSRCRKNEGAFDGANPIQRARIPSNAREPGDTYAYNLAQICRILEALPLLPNAVIATASYAGLREGELRGLEWPDYTGVALNVARSIWKSAQRPSQ